nr:MAG TPA: hypothetical protein [Caudoviricetes sp.]
MPGGLTSTSTAWLLRGSHVLYCRIGHPPGMSGRGR